MRAFRTSPKFDERSQETERVPRTEGPVAAADERVGLVVGEDEGERCTHKLDLDDQCYHVARRCRLGDLVPVSYRVQSARFYRVSVLPGLWAVAACKRRCPLGLRGESESLSLGQGRSPEARRPAPPLPTAGNEWSWLLLEAAS